LNLRPSGYEPDELPGCSTPRQEAEKRRVFGAALFGFGSEEGLFDVFGRPGDDLLSQVLRHSTIGAEAFDGRVRDGIGSDRFAEGHQAGETHRSKWARWALCLSIVHPEEDGR
jgi:hypothetical protein